MLEYYSKGLAATYGWICNSIAHGQGGSCGYFSPITGWSAAYPETTGYLIPTVLEAGRSVGDSSCVDKAIGLGEWLLSLQQSGGAWQGGLYRGKNDSPPSVFNTAQIIHGMTALFRETNELRWLDGAQRGALWLAQGVNAEGQWAIGNYRVGFNPSYYTQVAWPMLEVWSLNRSTEVLNAAKRVLDSVVARRQENGVFCDWGFTSNAPAFTHTIAYTLRGLLESAHLLGDWDRYAGPAMQALDTLQRRCELLGGRLPGAFDDRWHAISWYTCLTGNAQMAACLLKRDDHEADLRLVNTAAKLVDSVCATQCMDTPLKGIRGGVGGSSPLWGRYMFMRYPNWAAKYHCDAIGMLVRRLQREGLTT